MNTLFHSTRIAPRFSQHFIRAMSDTKSLPSRQPSASEQEVIDEVLSLYQAKPTEKSYSHYADNAVFHDPVRANFPSLLNPPQQAHTQPSH
jgi:hypothetical protein